MRRALTALIIASGVMPALAFAQTQASTPSPPSADQKGYIAYHYCMMTAAMKASHTDAKAEDIFRISKAQCANVRAAVIVGQESNHQFLAALDAADQEKATNFPNWVKGVRERRLAFERGVVAKPNP